MRPQMNDMKEEMAISTLCPKEVLCRCTNKMEKYCELENYDQKRFFLKHTILIPFQLMKT
jgi:hypothetical protein